MKLTTQLRIAQAKAAGGGLPLWRQLAEMAYLFLRHGQGPGYYLMARFWRRELPFADKARHWNGRRYLRFVHRVNDPAYFKVSQHKFVEKALLLTAGLPTAPLLGVFHADKGQGVDGRPLRDEADLRALLAGQRGRRLFFKPAEGDSGKGVFALDVSPATQPLQWREPLSDAAMAMPALLARCDGGQAWVIEQAITQHPALSALNPTSVNTLRMWVVHDDRGVRVVGAFLRVGRAGSLVDNTAAGGLACAIDLDSGRIRLALDLTLNRNEYVRHPDSQAPLPGVAIPHWPACVELACAALRVLPGARFAGMDIAVTQDGPVVVEYNVEPSQQGATHFDTPHGVLFAHFS